MLYHIEGQGSAFSGPRPSLLVYGKENIMAHSFGIPQLVEYLTRMNLKIARTDPEQEIIELSFHGKFGQWRIIVGLQQEREIRKLMLIAPHIGIIGQKNRLECLEALMAVNYRLAMGKFGLDLDDGEVRLEEAIPLAQDSITFEQFHLAFGALVQTIAMYSSLLPRIVYGNISVQEALDACEQDFIQEMQAEKIAAASGESASPLSAPTDLNVSDVLAEVSRIFEEKSE
jgi:hypothetical protein